MRLFRFVSILGFISLLICCNNPSNHKANSHSAIDSLLISWKKEAYTSTNHVMEQIRKEQATCTDSAIYYKMHQIYSMCLVRQNKFDSALIEIQKVISYCERNLNNSEEAKSLLATILNLKGALYQAWDKKDSAIVNYQKAVDVSYAVGSIKNPPAIFINIADCYSMSGNNALAADYYLRALTAADDAGLQEIFKFQIHSGLGKIYTDLKNFATADYYFTEIENEFSSRPPNEKYHYGTSRVNYYYSKEDYRNALFWAKTAHEVSCGGDYPLEQAVTAFNLGEVYLMLHMPDSAQYYLDHGKLVFNAELPKSMEYYVDGLYASLHLLRGELNKAEQLLTKDYSSYDIMPLYIYYNNKRLEELYSKRKDYTQAYKYRKLTDEYNDSLRNILLQNNIAEMNLRHEKDTMLLNRDIRILDGERKVFELRYEKYQIITVAFLLLALIIGTMFYWRRKKNKEFNKQLRKLDKMRVSNIKHRMNPHYIKNVVTAALPALRHSVENNNTLDLLVKSLRNELLLSDKLFVTLEEELEVVSNYIDLSKSTSTIFPTIKREIAGEVDLQMRVLSMIIEIPVENAIKSAFPQPGESDYISISVIKHEGRVLINIIDNGVGYNAINTITTNNNTQKGLQILKQTIELLNTRNTEKIEFNMMNLTDTHSLKPGTNVQISIPILYNYEL